MPLRRARWLPFAGLASIALFAASVAARSAVPAVDGEPASAWAVAINASPMWAQLAGYLLGLAGLALAAFAWGLHERALRDGGAGLAPWGRFAAMAWSASFLLAGAISFAAAEFAGYQEHAEGAKTALILGHLLYANPIAALLGAVFAFAVGLARVPGLPAWFRAFSLGAGGLGAAVTLVGSFGGIGLLGMAPVALWLVTTAVVAPVVAWGGGSRPG